MASKGCSPISSMDKTVLSVGGSSTLFKWFPRFPVRIVSRLVITVCSVCLVGGGYSYFGFVYHMSGRGDLVGRSRLGHRKVPDSTEFPPCMWSWATLNLTWWGKRPPAGVVRNLGETGVSSDVNLII
ncbi:hypothetical protein AVEN_185471-1 [Araneus ventricosus]|uniref:Uncharacterized protein n=1 Tax=Araneus ventricosus TaxID=182803 RepID=A0A4Y2HDI2_ARAVE|nr:hypothetical protein AVEN_185471-1 [Araneus ventricosus]